MSTFARIVARQDKNSGSNCSASRQVIKHVDAGRLLIELDAIKDHGAVPIQEDIPEMEIAVALANPSALAPIIEQRSVSPEGVEGGLVDMVADLLVYEVARGCQFSIAFVNHLPHRRRAAVVAPWLCDRV